MNLKELMPYIITIVALILVSLLRYGDKISEPNLMQIFMFLLGAIFGGVATYAVVRLKK